MTKTVFVFTCCVALASAAFAANQDEHKKKHEQQAQGQNKVHQQNRVHQQNKFQQQNRVHQQNKFQQQNRVHQQNKFQQQNRVHQQNKFQQQNKVHQQNKFQQNKVHQQNKFQRQNKFSQQNKFQRQNKRNLPAVQKNKQKFQRKHFNLANKPNAKIPRVKFSKNFRIHGSQNWKGSKYIVFRNYHPAWHNQIWWTSHHNHLVFVFGGWYFWNAGYWFPAWGYDPGAVYYYDGPIYASSPDIDPGQVVANVQSALQAEGYYQGDIDGILGPQTRAALADYQQDNGLEPTAAVDEPTLDSLGLS
jgi:Putative peptidoglycan binding domain